MFGDMKSFVQLAQVLSMIIACEARTMGSPRQARLSYADPTQYYYHRNIDGHLGTYSYGYDVSDAATGNTQFRNEERYPNGTIVGSYGYIDPTGRARSYRYIADARGYRVMRDRPYRPPSADYRRPTGGPPAVTTEPSVSWTRPTRNKNHIQNRNQLASNVDNNFLQPYFRYV